MFVKKELGKQSFTNAIRLGRLDRAAHFPPIRLLLGHHRVPVMAPWLACPVASV
jgi:hypothetical protein